MSYIREAKTATLPVLLILSGSATDCYALDNTTNTLIGVGGMVAANTIKSVEEARKQDEMLQKQLETQIKEEQEKIVASEKRMQDMQQFDQQFFSSSKQQQYEYLKKSELEQQANIKKGTAGVQMLSAFFGAATAPSDHFYHCR